MGKTGLVITVFLLAEHGFRQEQKRFDFTISGAGVFSKTTTTSAGGISDISKSVAYTGIPVSLHTEARARSKY
jgi:hypothetical protein